MHFARALACTTPCTIYTYSFLFSLSLLSFLLAVFSWQRHRHNELKTSARYLCATICKASHEWQNTLTSYSIVATRPCIHHNISPMNIRHALVHKFSGLSPTRIPLDTLIHRRSARLGGILYSPIPPCPFTQPNNICWPCINCIYNVSVERAWHKKNNTTSTHREIEIDDRRANTSREK